jgi:hypothetical protein
MILEVTAKHFVELPSQRELFSLLGKSAEPYNLPHPKPIPAGQNAKRLYVLRFVQGSASAVDEQVDSSIISAKSKSTG